jgi:mono/diheme cytochrome c family protein
MATSLRLRRPPSCLVALLGLVSMASARGRVDLTASYDGRLALAHSHDVADVAATLTQIGRVLTGTVAVAASGAVAAESYIVTGRVRGRRVRLAGTSADGTRIVWSGTATAGGVAGPVKLAHAGTRRHGRLAFSRRTPPPSGGGGPVCDNAYFTDEVMPKVLVPICAHCHVAGGQAASTSFRVTPTDPLATQASVALHVNAANPDQSRILEKPLALLPHGGGQQLVAGSPGEQILRHWVDLVAGGVCGGGPPGGPGGGSPEEQLYADNCGSCHGADARGTGARPDIRCAVHLHDPVRFGLGTGDGAMPAFPSLSDADVGTLATFLAGLCTASGRTGHDLFTSNCTRCHAADARGTTIGPNVRCAVDVATTVRSGRPAAGMPPFLASELSGADVDAVTAYVGGLCDASGPARPADLYLSNCARCHGATAGGGVSADGVHGPNIRCTGSGDFGEAIRFGEDAMPSFPTLTAADVDAIVAYVRGFCTSP